MGLGSCDCISDVHLTTSVLKVTGVVPISEYFLNPLPNNPLCISNSSLIQPITHYAFFRAASSKYEPCSPANKTTMKTPRPGEGESGKVRARSSSKTKKRPSYRSRPCCLVCSSWDLQTARIWGRQQCWLLFLKTGMTSLLRGMWTHSRNGATVMVQVFLIFLI